jgi:AAA domain
MRILSLTVEHFRCVRKAVMQFGPGLNVLYGPNDLGKSSLVEAIRAALLLQVSSREHKVFVDWAGSGDPQIEIAFESEPQRIWRVKKTFGNSPGAFLEESRNGVDFHVEARGRDVDGRLSEILRWGLAPPGGKGRPKGMPITFLSTALLAQQDRVAAILEQALSDDSDESGKKRLVEALQAVAEDPLFKAVLSRVQTRVDEAFSTGGRKRTGKNSPWIQVRERILRAEDNERQCNEQSQKTIAVEMELRDLNNQQLERRGLLENAERSLEEVEDNHKRRQLRHEILAGLENCNARLSEIADTLQGLRDAEQVHQELEQRITELRHEELSAQASLTAVAQTAQDAKEEVTRLKSDASAKDRLIKRTELEGRHAELRVEQGETEGTLTRIRSVETTTNRVRTVESESRGLTEAIAEIAQRHDESTTAILDADAREGTLCSIANLFRRRAAQQGIDEAEKGLAQIASWRAEVDQKRATIAALEDGLAQIILPTSAELEDFKQLDHQLQLARARLSVGLHVQLQPKKGLKISVRRDDEAPEHHDLDTVLETSANSKIRLDIEDVAQINLSGGAKEARDEAGRLADHWLAQVEPLLKRLGAATLDDLVRMASDATQRSQEIRDVLRAVAQLEQRVADQRDWSGVLADRQQELVAAGEGLIMASPEALDAAAVKLGISDLADAASQLDVLRTERARLNETERKLEGELSAANATSVEKEKSLAMLHEELLQAESAVGNWQEILPAVLDRQASLKFELNAINAALESLAAETDKTLAEAQTVLVIAEESRLTAEAEHTKTGEELRAAERLHASSEGELKMRREAAGKLDQDAAQSAIDQVQAELLQVPEPLYDTTDDMLADAREDVQTARNQLREIEDEIQAKRGALQHVGGAVAKERAEAAQEALKFAREREQVLENDYEAWELLRATLREAEQEEGVHLGRVLGDPIAQRFNDLTSRRYGALALGPNLETHAIAAAGDARSISSLSVGTRDQLATIFRLSLAEQLKSVVLLDDQLTQSDVDRMLWLRDLIRQVAAEIQIVVFTCRPSDYLLPAELKSGKKSEPVTSLVRSINLEQVIERSR